MRRNPYRLPNAPRVTIRQVLVFIDGEGEATLGSVVSEFGITEKDASVRLLKLYRWGYLRRKKSDLPPRVYHYRPTKFGKRTARRWRSERG